MNLAASYLEKKVKVLRAMLDEAERALFDLVPDKRVAREDARVPIPKTIRRMGIREQVEAALRAHGQPIRTVELRERVPDLTRIQVTAALMNLKRAGRATSTGAKRNTWWRAVE